MDRILADVRDPVYYTCLRILRSEDAAQDVTQTVLLSVFTKLNTLKNAGAYISWVNRITANACKDRLSKRNRELFLDTNENGHDPFAAFEGVDEQNIPDKVFDDAETRRLIVELVNKLSDEQRMCVMLYYYDEMKTREIADALDVSEGTVKSRLNYARKTLKEGIERLEKQGNIRLHGLLPIPFLAYCLKKAAEESTAPVTVQLIRAAAGKAAASGTAASGTAASGAATAASGTAAAAAAGSAAATIAGRILAGLLSVGLLLGIGYGIWHALDREPPEIPEEVFAAEDTPEPSASEMPVNTPSAEPEQTPASEMYTLYGKTYHQGTLFTVDQQFRTNDTIRLHFENDETAFTLEGAQFALETADGTLPLERRAGPEEIREGENGSIELVASEVHGKPNALTVQNLPIEASSRFRLVFTDAREDKPAASERIRGQAQALGMRLSVDQIYTDNGMGKIVLQVQNSWRRTCFGGSGMSAATLLTGKGRFETSVRRIFEPNADESVTLYFDNAEGLPESLSVDGIYMLDDAGQPTGEASSVTIRFMYGDPTQRPTAAPTATPTPTATATPTATPEPTLTPVPTITPQPVWSEWSIDEPPEDAIEVETRQVYRKRAYYAKEYSFSQYPGETKEEVEAAVDAAIAAELNDLRSRGFTVTAGPDFYNTYYGDEWKENWYKEIELLGPYSGWLQWKGDPNDLSSTEGLPDPGYGYTVVPFSYYTEQDYSFQYEFGTQYRYLR